MTPTLLDTFTLSLNIAAVWLLYGLITNYLVGKTVESLEQALLEDVEESPKGEEFDYWRLRYRYPALPLSVYAMCLKGLEQRGVVVKLFRVDLGTIIVDFTSVLDLPVDTSLDTLSVVVRRV